jgi:hypothetical protein
MPLELNGKRRTPEAYPRRSWTRFETSGLGMKPLAELTHSTPARHSIRKRESQALQSTPPKRRSRRPALRHGTHRLWETVVILNLERCSMPCGDNEKRKPLPHPLYRPAHNDHRAQGCAVARKPHKAPRQALSPARQAPAFHRGPNQLQADQHGHRHLPRSRCRRLRKIRALPMGRNRSRPAMAQRRSL